MWLKRKRFKSGLLLLICFMFSGLLTVSNSVKPLAFGSSFRAEAAVATIQMQAVNLNNASTVEIAPIAAGTTETKNVYDDKNNKLMYNRVTGMVFSEAGVVYSNDSQPLIYDDKEQVFEDSLQRRLDLVEKSTHGLQNYYLKFGEYVVRST